MKREMRSLILVVACLAGVPGLAMGQDTYNVSVTANTVIKVLGTSNLHDWSMETKTITGAANFVYPAGGGQPQSLMTLDIAMTVKDLKSGESLMDSRAYTALKADQYAAISFKVVSASIVPGQGGQFGVKSNGNLSIAGVNRPITIEAACKVNADGTITCNGTVPVKMSDYHIKPPTFMLGALRTGDALTINFSLVFKK